MNLVEKHIVKRTDRRYKELLELCHLSKNLYNTVLYTIRQHFFETEKDDTVPKKFLNFHKASRYLINQAVSMDIRTIIVGHNKEWKQEVGLEKETNQKFVQIPFDRLIWQLKYKGRLEGINVVEIEEGYTSKCSFLDSEEIGKRDAYAGRRTYRGLFVASDGRRINSDVNGSYNIMRKYLKCDRDAVMPADAGFVYNPVKIRF